MMQQIDQIQKLGKDNVDAALKSFKLRSGYHIELMAAEPLVMDPVAFQWGPDGKPANEIAKVGAGTATTRLPTAVPWPAARATSIPPTCPCCAACGTTPAPPWRWPSTWRPGVMRQ